MAESKELTPSAKRLQERILGIISSAESRPDGEKFIDPEIQEMLRGMTAAEMLKLRPPSAEAGLWTNDVGFCRRLGALLFGCSEESSDELPWQQYLFFTQIVNANFIKSLGAAIPS